MHGNKTEGIIRIRKNRKSAKQIYGDSAVEFALGKLYKITKIRNYLTDDRKIQTQKTLNPTDDKKIKHKNPKSEKGKNQ